MYLRPDQRHPESGLHYVHVIPDGWGAHVDVFAAYAAFATRTPWCSVWSPAELVAHVEQEGVLQNDDVLCVLWSHEPMGHRADRRCLAAPVYSEAIGDDSRMLRTHLGIWQRFQKRAAVEYDGVFAHTPWMKTQMLSARVPSFVLPMGWDPVAAGLPRWNAPKHQDYVYYGSDAGKRKQVMPYLKTHLGAMLRDVSGQFGRGLAGVLDTARFNLYVAHSDVDSFSTWRIWQTIATSACMVVEGGVRAPADAWPLVAGQHYVSIQRIGTDDEHLEALVTELVVIASDVDGAKIARRAFDEIGPEYTVERCFERHLLPASIAMKTAKEQGR